MANAFTDELDEVLSNLNYKKQYDELDEKARLYREGKLPFYAVAAQGSASVGGALADTAAGLFDLVTPDAVTDTVGEFVGNAVGAVGTALTPAARAISNSAVGDKAREINTYLNQHHPVAKEALLDFGSGVADIGGLTGVGKGASKLLTKTSKNAFNTNVKNMDTKLPGFYGNGKIGAYAATAKAVPPALYRTFVETFSPRQIQALKETGVPLGLYVQAVDTLSTVELGRKASSASKLNTKIKDTTNRISSLKTEAAKERNREYLKGLIEERDVLFNDIRKQAGAKSLSPEGLTQLMKEARSAASYLSGAESYQGILDIQFNESRPLIDLVFGSQVLDANKVSAGGLNNIWKNSVVHGADNVPNHVAENFNNHIKKAWKVRDKNWGDTQILIKNPVDHHSQMGYEIGAKSGNPVANFFKTASSVLTPEELADMDTMKSVFNLYRAGSSKGLTEEIRDFSKLKRKIDSGDTLNKAQQKKWAEISEKISKPNSSVTFDKKNGTFYINGSHRSQAKELGGVNVFGSYSPKNLNTVIMQSDNADMFGIKPIGGATEITVFPPLVGRILDFNDKKAKKGYDITAPEYAEGPEMGAKAIEEATGIPLRKKEDGWAQTPYQRQRMEAILASRDTTPDLASYATAANRAGTGLLTGNFLLGDDEENQQ